MRRIKVPDTTPGVGHSLDAALREQEAVLLASLRAEIQIGLDDIAAGRTVDCATAFAEVRRLIDSGSAEL